MAELSPLEKSFHQATETDNITKLKEIINKIVNSQDNQGRMPLQKTSNQEIIKYLVKIGANVNVQNIDDVLLSMTQTKLKL